MAVSQWNRPYRLSLWNDTSIEVVWRTGKGRHSVHSRWGEEWDRTTVLYTTMNSLLAIGQRHWYWEHESAWLSSTVVAQIWPTPAASRSASLVFWWICFFIDNVQKEIESVILVLIIVISHFLETDEVRFSVLRFVFLYFSQNDVTFIWMRWTIILNLTV